MHLVIPWDFFTSPLKTLQHLLGVNYQSCFVPSVSWQLSVLFDSDARELKLFI